MSSIGVSWNGKHIFFIDPQKTKVDQNCYNDLLKTSFTVWMSSTLSWQWLRLRARHSALPHYTKVTQQFLRQKTSAADEWASYSPDLNPSDYCIWHILQDLVYKGRRLQIYRISKRQSKTSERRSPLRQFENPLHNEKNDWMRLESRMEARFSSTFCYRFDLIILMHRRVEFAGYFVRFGHQILFRVFHC